MALIYNPRSKSLAALAESIGTVSVAGFFKLQISIKNLDSTMSFDKQISETCKSEKFGHLLMQVFNGITDLCMQTWYMPL